jgi:hypothetical protein
MKTQLTQLTLSRNTIRSLTKTHLESLVRAVPANTTFTLPELLGSTWKEECIPFYQLYLCDNKTAGIEMGKLLGVVARQLGCAPVRETKYGRQQITRWSKIS